jgi:DNA polymerase-3 subunit delta
MDNKLKDKILHEKEIKNIVESGRIGGLFFIFGNESFLKLHYAGAIASKAVHKDFEDFNLHRFDGKSASVENIAEAVESMPMFSEKTCVFINDLSIHNLEQNEIENLKFILSDIPDTCTVILLMDTIERKEKKEKKVNKEDSDDETEPDGDTEIDIDEDKSIKENVWDEILGIAIEKGHAVELNKKSSQDLANILIHGSVKRGHMLEFETAMYLIDCVGNDLSNLQNELDKVCSYAKSEKITKKDIDQIAVKSIEAKVFDMAKALLEKKFDDACYILNTLLPDTLFYQKPVAIQIMGAFISPFIDMYRAKAAAASGSQAINVADYYNYKGKEFRLTKAAKDITGISVYKLRKCLDLLFDADCLLKSTQILPKLVIEQTLARILMTINEN